MSRKKLQKQTNACPCGGEEYSSCCGKFHNGDDVPVTAEQLMRSRYTAYVLEDKEYLLQTWAESSRPANLQFDPETRWLGLKILFTEAGAEDDSTGVVEFVARYKIQGRAYRMQEASRFISENFRWVYLDGKGS